MRKQIAIATIVLGAVAAIASAQVGWDKHRPTKPLPNPSPVNGTREQIVEHVKTLLTRSSVAIKDEGVDPTNGNYFIRSEEVVFARGLVAGTQLGHFAETSDPGLQKVVRGRVTLRIEIAASTPTASRVSVFGTFEGQRAGSLEWSKAPSRGILEDRVLRYLVTAVSGGPVEGDDDDLLDTLGS